MSKINKKSVTAILIISLCAFFMVSPQIYKHALIVSNDWVFHMNRFYDTAMQLKMARLIISNPSTVLANREESSMPFMEPTLPIYMDCYF